jgi:hypothetical protein
MALAVIQVEWIQKVTEVITLCEENKALWVQYTQSFSTVVIYCSFQIVPKNQEFDTNIGFRFKD